jgi:hypothetical protein
MFYSVRLAVHNPGIAARIHLGTYKDALDGYLRANFGGLKEFHAGRDYIQMFLDQPCEGRQIDALNNFLSGLSGLGGIGGADSENILVEVPDMFYALPERYIWEESPPYRFGIEFQLVPVQSLALFLTETEETRARLAGAADMPHHEMYEAFFQHGWGDPRFDEAKITYLGDEPCYTAELYMDNTEAPSIQLGDWYRITMQGQAGRDTVAGIIYGLDVPEPYAVSVTIAALDEAVRQNLQNLYMLPASAGPEGDEMVLGALDKDTKISDAVVFDVGQGLCVGLYDETDEVPCFFDFSATSSKKTTGTMPAGQPLGLSDIIEIMTKAYTADQHMLIVLSHWHADHYNIIGKLPDVYMAKTVWFAPAKTNPTAVKAFNYIRGNNGQVTTVLSGFVPLRLRNNPNILIKCCAPPQPQNQYSHLHHWGMYMQLRFVSGHTMLLVGDTCYQELGDNVRDGMGDANGYLSSSLSSRRRLLAGSDCENP